MKEIKRCSFIKSDNFFIFAGKPVDTKDEN